MAYSDTYQKHRKTHWFSWFCGGHVAQHTDKNHGFADRLVGLPLCPLLKALCGGLVEVCVLICFFWGVGRRPRS